MVIVPAIDIMDGKVVRLQKGEFEKVTHYDFTPFEYAKKWREEGAGLIHIVDLDGARFGEPRNMSVVSEIIKSSGVKIEIGGGIRTLDIIGKYFEIGADRVVLSTKVIEDASFLLKPEVKEFLDRIVVSIDIRQMEGVELATATTGGWLKEGDVLIDIPSFLQAVTSAGVRYINFSDISRDGMLSGFNAIRIKNFLTIARSCCKAHTCFTYAGGVSSLEDIKSLAGLGRDGVDAVIIGRALYEKKISLKKAIEGVK